MIYILYIYDLKAPNKNSSNRIKRLFYYHLQKLPLKKESWKTKSAFVIDSKAEQEVDAFFRRFGAAVVVYKTTITSIEQL